MGELAAELLVSFYLDRERRLLRLRERFLLQIFTGNKNRRELRAEEAERVDVCLGWELLSRDINT